MTNTGIIMKHSQLYMTQDYNYGIKCRYAVVTSRNLVLQQKYKEATICRSFVFYQRYYETLAD